ncbi:hypothetical protein BJ138DRAFT_1126911 [Hygrophoropsis aurantiaca]|uniref:Uncharacterized protein n=1 Tax=Hygrophoropsis aurantiaca TaxID=72124 RepID=A0ACB8AAY3_9AGAM|nr:hypothetical protein BJ138DRAFT_1126911 [Hygrophoropsis aurantiaca]
MLPPTISPVQEQFVRNQRQQTLASKLEADAHQLFSFFQANALPGNALPEPKEHIRDLWNILPNNTVDIMPMSLKTGFVFVRAPPPSPVTATYPQDESSVFSESTLHTRSDDSGSLLIYETESHSPTPDIVAFQVTEKALSGLPDDGTFDFGIIECPTQKTADDGADSVPQSSESSSDGESNSSLQDAPVFTPSFQRMVADGVEMFRTQGATALIKSLLQSGVEDYRSASPVAWIAQGIIKEMIRCDQTTGKNLERALRAAAMQMFRQHWKYDGDWALVASTLTEEPSFMTLRGINIAGFLGSMFSARIGTAEDVALCLSLLLEGSPHFDRLCAMHALLVQANDKLCKNRNRHSILRFREAITLKDKVTGTYLWAPSEHAHFLLQDMLATIDGWIATQTIKRDRYNANFAARFAPTRIIGPRFDNVNALSGTTIF